MPAPVSVTDEQIIQAGRQMTAAGKRVAGWTLRAAVGAGKAARLLEVWNARAIAAEQAAPPPVNLPSVIEQQAGVLRDRLIADLTRLVAALWQTAERLAAERVKAEVDATRQVTADLHANLEAAETAVLAAETQRDELTAEVGRLTKALAVCQVTAAEHKGRADAAERRAERAEAATCESEGALRAAAEERGRLLERAERAEARAAQPASPSPASASAPEAEATIGPGIGKDGRLG